MKSGILHPRNRLISLRMTSDEYEQLCDASIEQGARCVSDFARSALLQSFQQLRVQGNTVSTDKCHCSVHSSMNERIATLEKYVTRLLSDRGSIESSGKVKQSSSAE